MLQDKDIERCRDLLRRADCVLVAAGSGLSAAAGLDYTDTKAFAGLFPGMVKHGFRAQYQLVGYTGWSTALKWGYLATHVNEVRFKAPPHPVYGRLLQLVQAKDYFVMTSNVDGMFAKNGFAEDRVFTPQGDYALMQCQTPCSPDTWPTKPLIDRILPAIDPSTQEVTDPNVLPRCPNCGEDVMMNVRGGDWFIEKPYQAQRRRFEKWVDDTWQRHLLVIEIGAGFNTPIVIRWPMERLTSIHPAAHLIRVNPDRAEVPQEIAGKSVSLQEGAMSAITAMWQAMANKD